MKNLLFVFLMTLVFSAPTFAQQESESIRKICAAEAQDAELAGEEAAQYITDCQADSMDESGRGPEVESSDGENSSEPEEGAAEEGEYDNQSSQ